MKKAIFLSIYVFAAFYVFAGGITSVNPKNCQAMETGLTFTFTFKPSAAWVTPGTLVMRIPDTWSLLSTTSTDPGFTQVYVNASGTDSPVSFTANGNTLTVQSLSLGASDYLKIVYGSKENGGPGVYGPYSPGIYPFNISVAPSDAAADYTTTIMLPLIEQPKVLVTKLKAFKASSREAQDVFAGDTVTYAINYNLTNAGGAVSNNTRIWDTLPAELVYLSSVPPPSLQSGRFFVWELGNLSMGTSGAVTITAVVKDGAVRYSSSIVNSASVYGEGVIALDNEIFITNESVMNLKGAALDLTLVASPSSVIIGETIVLTAALSNSGNYPAIMAGAGTIHVLGTGALTPVSTPMPAYASSLAAGTTAYFTWTYSASASGYAAFSSKASGMENSRTLYSNYAVSQNVTITLPTGTPTPEPTPVITPTQGITTTPGTGITPVETVNTSIPVYISKNHINPDENETLKIVYNLPSDGNVSVKIFNLNGELISTLVKEYKTAGNYSVEWDGKNPAKRNVGNGIYFIHVSSGKWREIKKVVVLK